MTVATSTLLELEDVRVDYVLRDRTVRAVDGVSLTVNEVAGSEFSVNIIPHTRAVTSFGVRQVGDLVNVEVDMLARYVARLREFSST